MTVPQLLLLLLVAGICGGIAQSLVGYSRTGCLGSIALGFIGALLGTLIARKFELPELFDLTIGDQKFPVIWSIIGASIFSAVLSIFAWRRPTDI